VVTRVTRSELERIRRMPTEADVERLAEELSLAWAERDQARELVADVPALALGLREKPAQHLLA